MIGNDVIDFKEASLKSDIFRRGFLPKLFTEEEQKCIHAAKDPILKTWIFWSMKESAYKAHQRRFSLPRSYNPLDFNCDLIHSNEKENYGKVLVGSYSYDTKIRIERDYLHCIAGNLNERQLHHEVLLNSKDVKKAILLKYSALRELQLSKLSLAKNRDSVPQLFYDGKLMQQAFSISHHGKFSAYLLALINY